MSNEIKDRRRVCHACVSRPRDEYCPVCDLADTTPGSALKVMRGQDDEDNPIAYMRNEGEPNNLVKCTFACPGAFGVYAHSSKDTDRLDWIERHDPDIRSDIDTDMEQNHWPTS